MTYIKFSNMYRLIQKRFFSSNFHAPAFPRANFNNYFDFQLDSLRKITGDHSVHTDPLTLDKHNLDYTKLYKGDSRICVQPSTVNEISDILTFCVKNNIAVNPQGGNTGLVGGGVPVYDEIILSTNKMNKILDFDETSGIVVCEAGVVLQDLDNFLSERGFIAPYDLGAKGSCQVGGNVATNAGGLRLVRYGPISSNLLGIEAVLPDHSGRVLDAMSNLRKDNTGLKTHLMFVGSEGSLGVISKVAFLCPPKPKSVQLALLQCDSFEDVLFVSRILRSCLSDIISAVEFFDRKSLECVLQNLHHARDPFANPSPFYLLVETHGQHELNDVARLHGAMEASLDTGKVSDAIVSDQVSLMNAIWLLRENIASAMVDSGRCLKYDVTLPVKHMYDPVIELNDRIKKLVTSNDKEAFAVGYGHLGDANIHINVLSTNPEINMAVENAIEPFIYERVCDLRGSISAEHGIGQQKSEKMTMQKQNVNLEIMASVKRLFDPKGIMSPYKLFPAYLNTWN